MSSRLAWYRYRNFSLMVLLLAAGNTCKISCQPVRINEQRIKYLPFNGNSIDATGNGNNATVYGSRVFPGNIKSVGPCLLVNTAPGIGRMPDHWYSKDVIDDIYIYNRAINACEVLYLYNGYLPDER